jgi:Uma2 family endonuclease
MVARSRVRYAADYIWEAPDDGNRYEVIDGELYVSPPPSWAHQTTSDALVGILRPFVRAHRLGHVVSAPGVILEPESGVQPDVVFVSNERAEQISERGVEGAPDLVVEILSPSTRSRDRRVKLRRYAAAKVPYYWILDPRTRCPAERKLVNGEYELAGVYGPGMTFRPDLFPGLEIAIDDLWE